MHTSVFELDHGSQVKVIHNGDWSGMATVLWTDSDGDHESEIPASLLLSLGGAAALQHLKQETICFLEGLEKWPAAWDKFLEEEKAASGM